MFPTPTDHPLPRDGSSQADRHAAALQPSFAPIDDRSLADLLVFAYRYADRIAFYNHDNLADGDWQPFFDQYPIIQLALISRSDAADTKKRAEYLLALAEKAIAQNRPAQAKKALRSALELALSTLQQLDHWAYTFDDDHPFYAELVKPFETTRLQEELSSVIAYTIALFGAPADQEILSQLDALKSELWQLDFSAIQPDADALALSPLRQASELRGDLRDLFAILFDTRSYLAATATAFIDSERAENGQQTPHLGLLLAFLRLFEIAQEYLNDLTRKHLDFYYREILQIQTLDAVPDRAFVVFELAKRIESEVLSEGSLVDAGKDDLKKAIRFALDREIAVNTAKVDSVQSLFIYDGDQHRVLSASVANSGDGIGGDLDEDDPSWNLFGHDALPRGRVGWSISSHTLKTTAGTKSFVVAIDLPASQAASLNGALEILPDPDDLISNESGTWILSSLFKLRLTGADAWLELDGSVVTFVVAENRLYFATPALDPTVPVSNYDAELHEIVYDTEHPVLEILFENDRPLYAYHAFAELEFTKLTLTSQVIGDNLLVAANDLGALDPAKAFFPLGPQPSATKGTSPGSSLFLGSQEIFSKKLSSLTFNLEWKDQPENLATHYADYKTFDLKKLNEDLLTAGSNMLIATLIGPPTAPNFAASLSYRYKGAWQPLGSATLLQPTIPLDSDALSQYAADPDLAAFETFDRSTARGFVKLTLASPRWAFGHKYYPQIYTNGIIAALNDGEDPPTPPNEPYTPVIATVSASYSAASVLSPGDASDTGDLAFHHIEPQGAFAPPSQSLLPAFPYAAALHIGLADLAPKQTVSLLFNLAEGSGNPFIDYPEPVWSYLANNQWIPFETVEILNDSTNELRRTGVITFSIPKAATLDNTRLPANRIWLRAAVSENPDAVNRAVEILPQAGEATFKSDGNDLSRLAKPLPLGSLAKLAPANSRIKKVSQPLDSLDGATAETACPYYRRVSERLRHKDRAIQIWDYERLALQAFPELYKAKCIPHTRVESELSPGDVLVVLVPDLNNRNAYNPLQPAVSQDTLAEVESYLKSRASFFANVKAINPKYEELKVISKVYLRPEYDKGAYEAILQRDIVGFLTPWAYRANADIEFGKSMHSSQILNFIEELEYVDYLEDFKVRHYVDGVALSPDPSELTPTSERSILVSAPSHTITVL